MARPRLPEARFDFRGGVNTSFSEDILDATEVRRAKNARDLKGAIGKRPPTKRIHDATLPSAGGEPVLGLYQWDAPAGRQVVAIADGNFYHKLDAATDFTEVASSLSTSRRARFMRFRTGASIHLYFADGDLRRWDGTTLTTSFLGAPDATDLVNYYNRAFAIDGTKRLYWSKRFDPTKWSPADDGGFEDVETYDAEGLEGIIQVGSSLLLCKEDNIARFRGVDPATIEIAKGADGVSPNVGLIAPQTLILADTAAFGVSAKGPWLCSEATLRFLDLKVSDEFDFANRAVWRNAVAAYCEGSPKGILVSIPAAGETTNLTHWFFDLESQGWQGPWTGFAVATAARFERSDETEALLLGGYDGRIRELETTGTVAKDDILRTGTGGTNITLEIELPPIIQPDPKLIKTLQHDDTAIRADLGADGSLVLSWSGDGGTGSVTLASAGAGLKTYRARIGARGRAITLKLTEASDEMAQINGLLALPQIAGRLG